MGKIYIIPDVHGRDFWKGVRNHVEDFDKIVFLGDYVSPYSHEGISNEQAIRTALTDAIVRDLTPKDKAYTVCDYDSYTWSCIPAAASHGCTVRGTGEGR